MPTEFAELFAALAAPFRKDEIRRRDGARGTKLNYITARVAMNRLDEVLGPENWSDEYFETRDGLKCRITITLPDGRAVFKEDGGAAAGMPSADDDEKSAFSDAFKRTCVKLGIARYLYRDGVPPFVRAIVKGERPAAPAPAPAPVAAPAPAPEAGEAPRPAWDEFEGPFVGAWNEWWRKCCAAARRDPGRDWKFLANLYSLRNAVVTRAVAAGKIEEARIARPAESGQGLVRDPAKAREALVWLYGVDRAWVEEAAAAYLRQKAGEASAATGVPVDLEATA